jgi:hypothetical protein
MIRALVIKELRECAPLAIVAMLAAAWALHLAAGEYFIHGTRDVSVQASPFLANDEFPFLVFPVLAGATAIALGLKQAVWEDMRGTYHYLLPRPVERSHVFMIKAAVGVAIVQFLGAAMILLYGAWAATPGTHASPFFWAMTLPAWKGWLVFPIVYLGALLSGLRPARWFGSRLLPGVACTGIALFVAVAPPVWGTLLGAVALCAVLAYCVVYVARTRDF